MIARVPQFKTDAPNHFVFDMMRAYVRQFLPNKKPMSADTPGFKILAREPSVAVDFTTHPKAKGSTGMYFRRVCFCTIWHTRD